MNKEELRTVLKKRRAEMTSDEVFTKSAAICLAAAELLEFRTAKTVMVYLSLKNEVQTDMIIDEAFKCGKNVLVPITQNDRITACRIFTDTKFSHGAYGIREPAEKIPWTSAIDLCIIPGLGFDKAGGRIGFGKGCYDRFLPENDCIKLAFSYSSQIAENVFPDKHDIPMDIIVTEKECIFCE